MNILLIGGTGFIGPYVADILHKNAHRVALFHRSEYKALLQPHVEHIHGDRNKIRDFIEEFKRFSPEIVLDMIPVTETQAIDLMEVFRGISGRIVSISSQDVYRAYGVFMGTEEGSPDKIPLGENSSLRENLYPYRDKYEGMENYDKISVEKAVMSSSDLPGTVLRLPMVYGPGDKQHRMYQYLKRMDDKRPYILLEEKWTWWKWTRGYVEDVAHAIVLAVTDERASGQIYNVGEKEALSLIEWVKKIGEFADWDGEIIIVPDNKLSEDKEDRSNTAQHIVIDSGKIRRELGYKEIFSSEEAFIRTVEWERENPPEKLKEEDFNYEKEDLVLKETG